MLIYASTYIYIRARSPQRLRLRRFYSRFIEISQPGDWAHPNGTSREMLEKRAQRVSRNNQLRKSKHADSFELRHLRKKSLRFQRKRREMQSSTRKMKESRLFSTSSCRIAVFSAQYSFAASFRIALKRKQNPE